MNAKQKPMLDAMKLYENAITSIQLGIEDFELSKSKPERALSSVRNLFSGMLLLFKYKIASSVNDPTDAYELIFNPPAILPVLDDEGGFNWRPNGNFKKTTIDVEGIKQRFNNFGIDVNWAIIKTLHDCRNELEHLHPRHTFGELAGFIANLFPVLHDFITEKLHQSPLDILGSSWKIMLAHKEFYDNELKVCENSWESADIPEGLQEYLVKCCCENCGSKLIKANQEDIDEGKTFDRDEDTLKYNCSSCAHSDLICPELFHRLDMAHDYDPRNGDEPLIEECYACRHHTFLIYEQKCVWCGNTLDYENCNVCDEHLKQDDQDNDGLCSYHYDLFTKND